MRRRYMTKRRSYRPEGLARSHSELCPVRGCLSLERVERGSFCKRHRKQYRAMMAKPIALRPLFDTWDV